MVNYGAGSAFDPDSVVLSGFVLSSAAPTDPDGNGLVNGRDLLILQRDNPSLIPAWRVDYGGPPSSVGTNGGLAAVPEPSSILLLVAGCILALSRRGNRI